jgi:hypothetical protein
MYCKNCGKQLREGARFCPNCGRPVPQDTQAKKRGLSVGAIIGVTLGALAVVLIAGWFIHSLTGGPADKLPSLKKPASSAVSQSGTQKAAASSQPAAAVTVQALARPQLLSFSAADADEKTVTPSVEPYTAGAGLASVTNLDQFYLPDEVKTLLEKNLFAVQQTYNNEFYELYEYNRYAQTPNFVTVDSLMHTYHLYFSLLLSRTEKNYLSKDLISMSRAMLQKSEEQYDALTDADWKQAAARNVAFFAVAASLQDETTKVPDYAAKMVKQELAAIMAAEGPAPSELAQADVDYSQFKPRGYYAGDKVLEPYFRAMMWYGQINFTQKIDTLSRSALIMTVAMHGDNLKGWEKIYTVTSFFAGESDDLGYYEYEPAIEAAYGKLPEMKDLEGNAAAYQTFAAVVAQMNPPAVNSVPVPDGTQDIAETVKGFRFMGQRFTLDAAVLQQLIYSSVQENASGEKRMLPDALDVPAALGSDEALQITTQEGASAFPDYAKNMQTVREALQQRPEDFWSSSLYSSWLYTLQPLLETKGDGMPSFMNSSEWLKKDLESYAGSYTELKHDTVLYAKQVMAEMGGGPEEPVDDRGYVEPETEIYRRFRLLAQQTADGLANFGYIGSADKENLSRLSELAGNLLTISNKELTNETLTDAEYDLIRTYGGTLEHFWTEAVKDQNKSEYLDPQEIPSSLVTDIATDPNGSVLEIADGRPSEILVIVPVAGKLKIVSGAVYNFYQFTQPISDRLTDAEWRQMIGQWAVADGMFDESKTPAKPAWTDSYRYTQTTQ